MTSRQDTAPYTCPTCGKVLPAESRDHYTDQRASQIVTLGLCVCAPRAAVPPPGAGPVPAQ